ncbi:hypothetical protein ACFQFC_07180 [Amorphoplanes digitatis]|uniref:Uncharacterized protein n=1 Tax=Actinoplanes digitatis TaxID=1868 RepID=A0A7W7I0B3_9ACTN|nr:hypothetical protein [Actinoplanes digitatis]MBB4763983.1 hypothetical protein [Actinoplanes digitatis]BFE73288.1 hypothetical protein GCM10020092_065890 [Actinoplanes digitatis]GID93802.1 hypothetical protein Adi01nite_32140 [Actinoplanes digitatis]
MNRTTLVVPARHAGSLDIPPRALDDASDDVVWVNAPTDGLRGSHRMAVPLEARSVRKAGRFLFEWRLRPLVGWLLFAAYTAVADGYMHGSLSFLPQAVLAAVLGGWLAQASDRPRQLPYLTHTGDPVARLHPPGAPRTTVTGLGFGRALQRPGGR